MSNIGLQLYTIKEEAQNNILGTLRKAAEIGYDGVEFAGYFGAEAEDIKKVLEETGLQAVGTVVEFDRLTNDEELNTAISYSKIIGCPVIICPWLQEAYRESKEAYIETAKILNSVGKKCREQNIIFLYHIHGYEFVPYDGKDFVDYLLKATDPEYVNLEVDVYWVEHASVDAVAFLQKCGQRSIYIHLKDMKDKVSKHDIEVGDGAIDMSGVIAQGRKNNVSWYIVEQEKFVIPPIESIKISLNNTKKLMNS